MDKGLRKKGLEALKQGDLGEDLGDGVFLKSLGTVTHTPKREKGEVETADPIERIRRKNLQQREELVGQMAAQLMDHYIEHLNDDFMLNPIRDGIPACASHPFPPGCVHSCKENVTRIRDYTLGDVFTWVKALIANNYEELLRRRPELKGWSSGRIAA